MSAEGGRGDKWRKRAKENALSATRLTRSPTHPRQLAGRPSSLSGVGSTTLLRCPVSRAARTGRCLTLASGALGSRSLSMQLRSPFFLRVRQSGLNLCRRSSGGDLSKRSMSWRPLEGEKGWCGRTSTLGNARALTLPTQHWETMRQQGPVELRLSRDEFFLSFFLLLPYPT